jgi:ribosomal-protein-alanine N-acetyltransferase
MSRSSLTLAEGGLRDLDAVMRVMEESFDPSFGEAWTGPQCAGLLPMPGVWMTLARDGDAVVGFSLSRIVLIEAELLLLAVSKNGQRAGIGRRLLERFIGLAADRGAEKLYLEVRDGNEAVRLYNALGFREIGRRRNYYTGKDGQLYDAITLSRSTAD